MERHSCCEVEEEVEEGNKVAEIVVAAEIDSTWHAHVGTQRYPRVKPCAVNQLATKRLRKIQDPRFEMKSKREKAGARFRDFDFDLLFFLDPLAS